LKDDLKDLQLYDEKTIDDVTKLIKDNAFKLKQSPPAINVDGFYD